MFNFKLSQTKCLVEQEMLHKSFNAFPVGKIAKKSSLKECVFINSAFKIQCHVVKNTLLQTAYFSILYLIHYRKPRQMAD